MLTDELIAKLKEANAGAELNVTRYEEIDADIVFKTPGKIEWRRFQVDGQSDAKRLDAIQTIVFVHVVYPTKEEFGKLVEARPGIVINLFGEISDAVGVSLKAATRKL